MYNNSLVNLLNNLNNPIHCIANYSILESTTNYKNHDYYLSIYSRLPLSVCGLLLETLPQTSFIIMCHNALIKLSMYSIAIYHVMVTGTKWTCQSHGSIQFIVANVTVIVFIILHTTCSYEHVSCKCLHCILSFQLCNS